MESLKYQLHQIKKFRVGYCRFIW